ncbi:MAG TPA: clostripain-related cysteine peptidase [Pyrinomonadaceae bacterium]
MPSDALQHAQNCEKKPSKEWTIMVFCAGDNELSPIIVSQLKDLKDAGHHKDVNVLVYFDANEKGVPTRVYRINQNGRNCHSQRSYTYVDNLASDNVKINPEAGPAARKLWEILDDPFEKEAEEALSAFLKFCREQYPAKHFALVLVGHGMIVANDAFLPDEFPLSSITLRGLGKNIDGFGGNLELLGLHSCSMSAVEVAYELKGKAKYMIASEGPSYVQGWPYRKLLQKLFGFLNESNGHNNHNGHNGHNGSANTQSEPVDVRHLLEGLYSLASSNGLDFTLSGYSQDLSLINLDPGNFPPLTAAIEELVSQLKRAMNDECCVDATQLIQLAHLESQSYFNESYTDLYDFCLCLSRNCNSDKLKCLKQACEAVMAELETDNSTTIGARFSKLVVRSTNFGSLYQHSHGLSVYFPWTQPLGDEKGSVLKRYKKYKFTREFQKENSWRSFLKLYLKKTEREARHKYESTDENITLAYVGYGVGQLSMLEGRDHKTSGASGSSCSCISIKNFPTVKRTIKGKKCRMRGLAISQEFRGDQQEVQPKHLVYAQARTP